MSKPIMILPCGHGVGSDFNETVDRISVEEAFRVMTGVLPKLPDDGEVMED